MTKRNRNQIILVCPANQSKGEPPIIESDYSDYPSLGLLALGSSLLESARNRSVEIEVLYFDGALWGNEHIYDHIDKSHKNIFALGFSCFSLNFKSCLEIISYAKSKDPEILTICGNDHFSFFYDKIMQQHRDIIDFGFCGNDVVNSFTTFMLDRFLLEDKCLEKYPGLVYCSGEQVLRNEEEPEDYFNLPMINYQFIDSLIPGSQEYYFYKQGKRYEYMGKNNYKGTVIDIARGCIKYRVSESFSRISMSKCEFCSIYSGSHPIVSRSADDAWNIMEHAYNSGYDYFFLATDEVVLTFWPLIKKMVEQQPEWYKALKPSQRPRMWIFSRADGFDKNPEEKVDALLRQFYCDHINIGLDGFSEESLRIMNKGLKGSSNLLKSNFKTCELLYRNNASFSIGGVLNHIGITKEIMEKNFENICYFINRYASHIIEYSFDYVVPMPGNRCFEYLINPSFAIEEARRLGVEINERYLKHTRKKYENQLYYSEKEVIEDFIRACCPGVDIPYAHNYLKRIRDVMDKNKVQFDCDMLLKEGFLEE
jgi:hypothetical protein